MNHTVSDHRDQRLQMLREGLDLLDQGFTVFDADLRLVAWNRAFMRLLEFPDHLAFEGADFASFIRHNALRDEYGADDPEMHIAERVAAARAFTPHDIERVRPDGRVLRVLGQPLPGHGFVTLYSDVTEQRRAEQVIREHNAELELRVAERTTELRRSEQQMRLITDSVPALIAYVDPQRHYRYVNRGYTEWFGLDPSKPEVISAREFLGPTTYESIKTHIATAFGGERIDFEYELEQISGKRIRARTSLIPDIGIDGQVAGCFELTFDVSELRRAHELVMRAQKMEALGVLTGGLAHDFNNLLTVISGNLGFLAQQRSELPQGQEFVEPAMQAARRGAELIKRLLSFARQQPLMPAAIEVQPALANVARLVRPSMPDNLQVVLDCGAQPLWLWVDPAELESALLNLLINARDATTDATTGAGTVRLTAEAITLAPDEAALRELDAGDYVRIDVVDNGSGMDAATLARVFEPFFTTKAVGRGTGLGLAMVYGFARQSAGAVRIESRPGAGATISLWLPATEPVVRQQQPGSPDESASPAAQAEAPLAIAVRESPGDTPPSADDSDEAGRQPLALLVEDDAEVRHVVRRSLVRLGYAVLEAENGVEAREMLECSPRIDLLVTDLVMPGDVDGRDLAREAHDGHGVAKVLLMSGHAPARAEKSRFRLLAKPFTHAQLVAALQEISGENR